MASRPQLQALIKQIEADGGDEALFDRYRAGEKIADIMDSYGFSRGMFYHWIKAGGDERKRAYEAAKIDSADAMVDKARDELEKPALNTAPTSAEVNLANSRAKFYQWLAAKRNRAEYGDDALVAINQQNITLGDLHLQALLKHGLGTSDQPDSIEEVREAEVLMIEPGPSDATEEFEADPSLVGEA